MAGLTLPGRCAPTNLRLSPSVRARLVDSDMFDICTRIKEIDENLFIIDLEDDDDGHCYAIMENARDGSEQLVFRVQTLDERVLKRLRYILAVPLAERMEMLEKDGYAFKESEKERQSEELYDRMGRAMWTQMEHDGFCQRGVSYAKRGVAQPKRYRRAS